MDTGVRGGRDVCGGWGGKGGTGRSGLLGLDK